jgi:hypothetical protein
MRELLVRGKDTIDPQVIDPGGRSVEIAPWKVTLPFTFMVVLGRQQMTEWRMRIAIPKATDTHSQYVTLIAFPLRQCLHERASMLRYTCISYRVVFYAHPCSPFLISSCALRLQFRITKSSHRGKNVTPLTNSNQMKLISHWRWRQRKASKRVWATVRLEKCKKRVWKQ